MLNWSDEKLNWALDELEKEINRSGDASEKVYFAYHRNRFFHTGKSITRHLDNPPLILDIGSHYLHQSIFFKLLGCDVCAVDVPVFAEMSLVRTRAERYGVDLKSISDFENGLSNTRDGFELILFTEILEHITFNPVQFWRSVYDLSSDRGLIYISTPNGLRLWNLLASWYKLITLEGTGIRVHSIFNTITYGHHWKEYSAKEVIRYFKLLSPDFSVNINYYAYTNFTPGGGWKDLIKKLVISFQRLIPIFRDELEAVVRINKRHGFKYPSK